MNSDLARDKVARQRFIARSAWFTVPGTLAILVAGYAFSPPLKGIETQVQQVLLALQWLPIALLPYVAVCLHIAVARFIEGSHNPLAGAESESLKIHCRVMQNTLEQFSWFAIALLSLATLLPPARAAFIPVACLLFALSRVVYWFGYRRGGTLGRAPGVQITFTLNIALLALALARLGKHLLL